MRIPRTLPDPKDPRSIVEYQARTLRILDGGIEFGSPQDPRDPTSTTAADGAAHNGTLVNMTGAWVQLVLDDATNLLNTEVTCTHNLGVQTLAANNPNVRWLVFGWQHNNTGAGAGSTLSVAYTGGTVTDDSIQLRFFAAARTVTAANPLTVTLFFVPAVRG